MNVNQILQSDQQTTILIYFSREKYKREKKFRAKGGQIILVNTYIGKWIQGAQLLHYTNFRGNYHQATILMIFIFSYIPINTYTTCWFFCCITTYVCSSYLILIYLWIILPVKKKIKIWKKESLKTRNCTNRTAIMHLKQICFFMQNCSRYENACLM